MKQIREASGDYTPPTDTCTSYKALYQGLREFEADLHQHVHLENNILFPRAVEWRPRSSDAVRDHADFTCKHRIPVFYLTAVGADSRRSVRNHEGAGGSVVSFPDGLCRLRSRLWCSPGRSSVCGTCSRSADARASRRSLQPGCEPTVTRGCDGWEVLSWESASIPSRRCAAERSLHSERHGCVGRCGRRARHAVGRNVYLSESRLLCRSLLSSIRGISRFLSRGLPASAGRLPAEEKLGPRIRVVISASMGLLLVLLSDLGGCLSCRSAGHLTAFPHLFDQRSSRDGVGIPGTSSGVSARSG